MKASSFSSLRHQKVLPDSVYRAAAADGKEQYKSHHQDYDLITDDLKVSSFDRVGRKILKVTAVVEIAHPFLGFSAVTAPGTPANRSPREEGAPPVSPPSPADASPVTASAASSVCSFALEHSLSMLGVDVVPDSQQELVLDPDARCGRCTLSLAALSPLGILTLDYVAQVGAKIGRIFCRLPRRMIRSLEYINRMSKVVGVKGHSPIDSAESSPWTEWKMEMVDGRVVMWVPLCNGVVRYGGAGEIHSLLPTVGMSLLGLQQQQQNSGAADCSESGDSDNSVEQMKMIMAAQIKLHQNFVPGASRLCVPNDMLLVRTVPLRFACLFGRVVQSLLPAGAVSASSNIIAPFSDSNSAGAIRPVSHTLVFSGSTSQELTHVPVEFFSLESYREQVPMSLRGTLPQRHRSYKHLAAAFSTAPSKKYEHSISPQRGGGSGSLFPSSPAEAAAAARETVLIDSQAAVFITKGGQLDALTENDWVLGNPIKRENHHLITDPEAKLNQVSHYLHQQAEYPILSAINTGDVTSEGVLLTKYFPSPVMKSLLLSRVVTKKVRAIVFSNVSRNYGQFFSTEDRNMCVDLDSFGIQLYFCNTQRQELFQYTRRHDATDVGCWVPMDKRDDYLNATFFGVYGSNLVEGDFEKELELFLSGIKKLRDSGSVNHELLRPGKPLALVTGGGPGVMEVGNRVAKKLGYLSVGMIVDFGSGAKKPGVTINEQKINPYVDIFTTYRLEKLVERQADFCLHLPVFLQGGVGTDFERALEDVRRKVGTTPPYPMIFFGDTWPKKIGAAYQTNLGAGVIKGSEWLSNLNWVVDTGGQALDVLTRFFQGTLPCGPKHPGPKEGFVHA